VKKKTNRLPCSSWGTNSKIGVWPARGRFLKGRSSNKVTPKLVHRKESARKGRGSGIVGKGSNQSQKSRVAKSPRDLGSIMKRGDGPRDKQTSRFSTRTEGSPGRSDFKRWSATECSVNRERGLGRLKPTHSTGKITAIGKLTRERFL